MLATVDGGDSRGDLDDRREDEIDEKAVDEVFRIDETRDGETGRAEGEGDREPAVYLRRTAVLS